MCTSLLLIFKCSHIQLNKRNVPGLSSGAVCVCVRVCVTVCLRRDTDYDGVKQGPRGNGSTHSVFVCVVCVRVCVCISVEGLGQLSQSMKPYAAQHINEMYN